MIREAVRLTNRILLGKPPAGGPENLASIELATLEGAPFDQAQLEGKVVLVVNVASKCGLTPQYAALEKLQETYGERGLQVVGVPCNQFLGQEPGSAEEIATFCSLTYGVTFPLLKKQAVNGSERSPLYQWLIGSAAGKGDDITWNFEKFLLSREHAVVARFSPTTVPDAPEVIAAIEKALG